MFNYSELKKEMSCHRVARGSPGEVRARRRGCCVCRGEDSAGHVLLPSLLRLCTFCLEPGSEAKLGEDTSHYGPSHTSVSAPG